MWYFTWNLELTSNILFMVVVCSRHLNLQFQNQGPLILLPSFFKECLNPQNRINKIINLVSITTLVFQNWTQGYILSYFYSPLSALFFFREFVEFSLKAVYTTMFGKKFQIYDVHKTLKIAAFILCALWENYPSNSYCTPRQSKITHAPFFLNKNVFL